jgi:hypothetical protein
LIQLGALSSGEIEEIAIFWPTKPVRNWRNVEAGQAYPIFALNIAPDYQGKHNFQD